MLGLLYHHATLLPLILIATFNAPIFTNAILKNLKKMKKIKVYISGKIGEEVISEATRQKFARAERMLRAKGYEVFNPCNAAWQRVLKRGHVTQLFEEGGMKASAIPYYDYCLLRDLMALSTKDAVYFLQDWDKSSGANTEHSFAMATGKRLLWERLEDAQIFHDDDEKPEDVWLPMN